VYLMDCGHEMHFLLPVCFEPPCSAPPSGKVDRLCCSEDNFRKIVSLFGWSRSVNITGSFMF
jgi:hypothetical protein